jgi:hypothetical protein
MCHEAVNFGPFGAGRVERRSYCDPDPPSVETVVDAEDPVGANDRHRDQRNTGLERQPGRPGSGPREIE